MSERDPDVVVVTGIRRRARTNDMGAVAFPAWSVTLDGTDLTDKMAPRLKRLSIAEKRAGEADQLDIELDASDGLLAIPKAGAVLAISLGWIGGGGTTAGLIDKGLFTVDEVQHSGPPDTITLRARSADFTAQLRASRDQSWRGKTLGQILSDVAGRNQLTLKIADTLKSKTLTLVAQSRESDIALIARLGKEHDAVATIKAKTLIFLPMSGGKTATGQALPVITLAREDGDRHTYQVAAREEFTGVIAKWHSKAGAKQIEVTAGAKANAKTLKTTFPTAAKAQQAANAEWGRIQRAPRKLSIGLALGRPEIMPESPVRITGFHADIADQDWIIASATHSLDSQKGLTTSLELDVFNKGAASE